MFCWRGCLVWVPVQASRATGFRLLINTPSTGEKGDGICHSLLNCFPYGAVFGAIDVLLLGQMEMDDVCSFFNGFPVGVSVD